LRTLSNIERASLRATDDATPFVAECDASAVAVSETLHQGGRPVALHVTNCTRKRTQLSGGRERSLVNIEAVRKWTPLLQRQHFTLVTDQRSVAFMLDSRKWTKVKRIARFVLAARIGRVWCSTWYRPGKSNVGPDVNSHLLCGPDRIPVG